MTAPWHRMVVTLRPAEVVQVTGMARVEYIEPLDGAIRLAVYAPDETRIYLGGEGPGTVGEAEGPRGA